MVVPSDSESSVDGFDEYAKAAPRREAAQKSSERRQARLEAKSKTEHSVPMVGTPAEREERDKQRQWAIYEKWQNTHKKELLAGPEGEQFGRLIGFLKGMTIEDSDALIEAVKESEWLNGASEDTKQQALRLIDSSIIKLRLKAGLSPFDDALWNEPWCAFQVIRKHLTGVGSE